MSWQPKDKTLITPSYDDVFPVQRDSDNVVCKVEIGGLRRSGSVVIDFGASSSNNDTASVTVPATWVTNNSIIAVSLSYSSTADHSSDEVMIEQIQLSAGNIINGVSFDILASCPSLTWGDYNVNYIAIPN